ncbi:MAG: hypothetical protein H6721_06600 [Sandaracinus sp.]|nr:hypothetical protein [Sandaracinus sp.]MCB9612771.1 hypothetical protein [Sandaracinus sp.]MCB9618246.1 hypothetical protein [Sandaracinus sp.]MCB9631792.1 hypothetical protein [Sandaracinus sp.]
MNTRPLLFAVLLAVACGDDDGGGTDAGRDASVVRDAGGGTDAGEETDAAVAIDAGGEEDAGTDAGPPRSPGCVDGAGLDEGEHTFSLDGNDRRYLLYLPTDYSRDRAWPVVFALHGNGGSVSYWNSTTGDRNVRGAFEDDAILVIAEAIDGAWRDYDMPSDTWPARIELELNYFDAIRDELRGALCVKDEAIFTMGFSGGGSFSGVLACRRDWIRAMAVGGSVIYFDTDACTSTPASWITIGTEELVAGREAFRDFFRDAAGCEATSMPTNPEPCIAYDGCDGATPVHYCQHPAGHVWPSIGTDAAHAFFARFW